MLITSLNIKEIQIRKLVEKVKELEKIVSVKSSKSLDTFKWDLCDYGCNLEKVLQSHRSKKNKREILRDNNSIPEMMLHLSPLHSERIEELNESLSFNPSEINFYDCPLCEECSIKKTVFEIHLAQIQNVHDCCDCDKCIECTFKKVSNPKDFSCFICEKDFQDQDSYKHHLKFLQECSVACGICFNCIECAVHRRWKHMEWVLQEDGIMVFKERDQHRV